MLAAVGVGVGVFTLLPGCAYGCPPESCGEDVSDASANDARVTTTPTITPPAKDAAPDAEPRDGG
jgi:hypothetical protein